MERKQKHNENHVQSAYFLCGCCCCCSNKLQLISSQDADSCFFRQLFDISVIYGNKNNMLTSELKCCCVEWKLVRFILLGRQKLELRKAATKKKVCEHFSINQMTKKKESFCFSGKGLQENIVIAHAQGLLQVFVFPFPFQATHRVEQKLLVSFSLASIFSVE